jgi:phosphomannomutase
MNPPYVPTPDAILTALQVAEWLNLKNAKGEPQPRQVQRLRIPAIRLSRKTIRYRAATVAKWLEKHQKAA